MEGGQPLEPTIVTQCADIVCNSHLRALRLGGNPHLSDAFVRALIRAVGGRCTNPNLEMVSLGHFPLDDQKLLKVLEVTIDQAAHSNSTAARKKALVGGAEQTGAKSRRIDPDSQLAARLGAVAPRHRATPRTSDAPWDRRHTPASAAVSPPQTAPRSRNGHVRPRAPAPAAGTEPTSPWPLPPQALRPSPRSRTARRGKEVHLVSLSRLSPQAERQLAQAVAVYF